MSSPNIKGTLIRLAVPATLAQLANLMYNMVGRIFIGKLPDGDVAMSSIGITMPIIMIIAAFTVLVGYGGAPIVAIALGEDNKEKAQKVLGNSFCILIIMGIVQTVVFHIFKEPLLWKFGASRLTIGYAVDYLSIYLWGIIFAQLTLGMNPFINTQGHTKVGMVSTFIGAFLNLLLCPLFIFYFNMGVKGAALASVIAQFAAMLWVLRFLFGKQTKLKIRKEDLILDKKVVLTIASLGIVPFIMNATDSAIIASLNTQLLKFSGDLAVSSMTVALSVMQIVLLPLAGAAQGAQPILGYNYGAGNKNIVKATFKILFSFSLIHTLFWVTVIMIYPYPIIKLFNSEPALVAISAETIRYYLIGTAIIGGQISIQQTFISLGRAKESFIIVILRKVVLLLPLIYILPNILSNQYHGVLLASPVADITSTIFAFAIFYMFYKRFLLDKAEVKAA